MRSIGLDVHRDFCEVAIITDGVVASAPRVPTTPHDLFSFAKNLRPTDQIVLENTSNARAIAAILEPHVARVAIANPLAVKLIAHARVKTDKIDARVLAQLLAAGFLPEVCFGDEDTRALRRRVSRRGALVKQRTAAKNEIHAVLMRTLTARPPATDLFGVRGRAWLARQLFAPDEQETVAGCLRQIDMLDSEVAVMDQALATIALGSSVIRRLMTIPGIDMLTASALASVIGDVSRFPTSRHLVSYLGLNPTVHQSGIAPARMGRISKAGSSVARWALVEAAWTASKAPGPLHAFAQRIGARRGKNIAAVAVARKLTVLAWHMLSKGQDYAFARPSMVATKVRKLELTSGAKPKRGVRGTTYASDAMIAKERAIVAQAEVAYTRMVSDWKATRPAGEKKGAGATTGARIH
ncbi:MAG: IS110 family transposase [Actinomycetota bacterium]